MLKEQGKIKVKSLPSQMVKPVLVTEMNFKPTSKEGSDKSKVSWSVLTKKCSVISLSQGSYTMIGGDLRDLCDRWKYLIKSIREMRNTFLTSLNRQTTTAVIELVSTCHDNIYFQLRWRRAFSAIVRQQRAQKQTSRLAAPSTENSKPDDTSTTVQQPRRSIIRAATCTHKPQTTNSYAERGLATRTAVHRTKSEGGYIIFFLLFWSHKKVTFKEKRFSVDDMNLFLRNRRVCEYEDVLSSIPIKWI